MIERLTLNTIADIQGGYQAKSKIQESKTGTHRLIQGKDFDSSHCLRIEGLARFYPERKPEIYAVHEGDILFQARGVVHFAYCIEKDLNDTLAAASFYILRVTHAKLLPQYLSWWLNQPEAQNYFKTQGRTGSISFISKKALSSLKVQIPPLSFQTKVINIVMLARREQSLLARLEKLRAQLVKAVCIKAIQDQEK